MQRRKWGISCETGRSCALSVFLFFLVVSYIRFFFPSRGTWLIKASNSKTGKIREPLLDDQQFPSSFSLSLSVGGELPSPSPSRGFILAPPFDLSLTIPRRPTLRIILVIYEASNLSVRASSQRNVSGSQITQVGNQTVYCHP
jgi:hypothetical protein